jgi:hypothetical protein
VGAGEAEPEAAEGEVEEAAAAEVVGVEEAAEAGVVAEGEVEEAAAVVEDRC